MYVYHDVGKAVELTFLILDGLGVGLTGKTPSVRIQRRSDGQWWNGVAWQVALFNLPMVEVSAVNMPGSYSYVFNQATAGGATDDYHCYFNNPEAPPLNLSDDEWHMFKPGGGGGSGGGPNGSERRVQGSMAEDGVTFRLRFWIEEAGRRVTDYDSFNAKILDVADAVVVDLGTLVSDNPDGEFIYATPVAPINRNVPYTIRIAATRGFNTDDFNFGFVRV